MLNHLQKDKAADLTSSIEEWAYVFKDEALRTGVKEIPETKKIRDIDLIVDRNICIREFINRIAVNKLPHNVYERYMEDLPYYSTAIKDFEQKGIVQGFDKGSERGIAQGIARGIEQGKAEQFASSVRSMRAGGLTNNQISTYLNSSLEEVSEVPPG